MNDQDMQRLAKLSHLQLGSDEINDFKEDLSKMIDFVEQHAQVDLDKVDPLSHPLDIPQRLRPDSADKDIEREALQSTSPQTQDGYYLVPKVIG